MPSGPRRRRAEPRTPWLTLARVGQAQWFFGNLYEAAVDMPRLLADARPRRAPTLLGAGSPLRYYAPVAPVTFVATAVALVDSWRSDGDRRLVLTAAAGTASAAVLSGYLIRTVNLRLLRGEGQLGATEARDLARTWHRVNLVRLSALVVASSALRRIARSRRESNPRATSASPEALSPC